MTKTKPVKRIWSWGFGTDSTAGIEFDIKNGIQIDEIISSDPGNEMQHTYDKVIPFYKKRWEDMGYKVTIIKRPYTLYDHFYDKKMVPMGWVYPYCSDHFKRTFIRQYYNKNYYKKGYNITECIGHTFLEEKRLKFNTPKYIQREYPNYNIQRTKRDCEKILPLKTGKSACWFCPNKSWRYFYKLDKSQINKLVMLEDNAEGDPKPTLKLGGSMRDNILNQTSLDDYDEDWDDFNCSDYCYT